MKGVLEYKNINTSVVKDVDVKKGIITGYLSDFDTKDYDGDVIVKGAYKKSITERHKDIKFLNHHLWHQPHGGFDVLQEDSKGLYFESTPLVKGVSYSDDTMKLYEAGIIKEHSVGFITVKADYDKKEQARIIKEIKLLEGSNVTLGANPNTPYLGMKSAGLQETNDQVNRIVKMLRNGSLTDETFVLLEIALKQLQKQAFEIGKQSLKTKEPSEDTLKDVDKPNNAELIKALNNFKF